MTGTIENTAVVILAAGKGTRMRSDRAKVLHELDARPMIHYVVKTALAIAPGHVHVVVGHQAGEVQQAVARDFDTGFVTQSKQLGTGHAVQCALPYLAAQVEHLVILCGDVPLLTPATVQGLLSRHVQFHHDITVLAVQVSDPTGYGRVLVDGHANLQGIVEEADADERQKKVNLINSGIYCVRKAILGDVLGQVKADNAQQEFYLTDIIGIGRRRGLQLGIEIGADAQEVMGINTRAELERAEQLLQS